MDKGERFKIIDLEKFFEDFDEDFSKITKLEITKIRHTRSGILIHFECDDKKTIGSMSVDDLLYHIRDGILSPIYPKPESKEDYASMS